MAKHEIKIHENTSPTKEVAQYLGSYITKTTVSLTQLCKSAAELSGVPELKLQTLIENDIDAFIDLERKGACRIHVDGGYVELRILGTFPAADSPWDPAKNALVVAFTPDDEIRNHLINEVPKIVTDETSTKVRVTNVFDVAHPKPTELIHGRNEYQMQGYNLCMDDVGAKVELVNTLGVRFECTVVRVINRQNIVCRSNAVLEPGDYKAFAYSRGGDPEGQLLSDSRKVKYESVVPSVDDIASEGHEGEIVSGTAFAANGSGLDAFDAEAGDTVKVKWTQGGEEKEAEIEPTEVTAAKMSFEFPDALVGVPVDTELTFEITFGETLKTKGAKIVGE